MQVVASSELVLSLIKQVKDLRKGYLTNLFLDFKKIELWIRTGLFEFETLGETVFFLKNNKGFSNLYYCTPSTDVLNYDLALLLKIHAEQLFIVDVVGKENDTSAIRCKFAEKGFYEYTSLVRMNRLVESNELDEVVSPSITYACRKKGNEVYDLLQKYFNPKAEQLPLQEEIDQLVDGNRVIIYRDDSTTVQGFLIYELIGLTSYLRYWFVHPDFREKKIGSQLLRKFFTEAQDTKRQLFWVIESNANAIKRYEHFGFKKEDLKDFILVNKNIKYER